MLDVDKIRADFPILERMIDHKYQLIYLDSGATAQKPKMVIDKLQLVYTLHNSNIHRGVHTLSGECTTMYEQARETVREFISADSIREIIFTSGATASINLVALSWGNANVGKGDEVLVSEMEHHSNIIPWQMLCQRVGAELKVLPLSNDGELQYDKLDTLLTSRTKLVAVTHASNVLGTINNLPLIIEKAHSVGAVVMVDGCQGIVHHKVDVKALDCDFYAFSGHKLYGPTGIGVLYAKESLLTDMPPVMGGGDMVAKVSFEKTTYAQLPLKFEAGTTNYIGAIGMAEAIKYVRSIGQEAICDYENSLLEYAMQKLDLIEGLVIYGRAKNRCSIISFNVDGIHSLDLGMILNKLGIAIRTGALCAEPIMDYYGVKTMIRASFAMYNTFEEIDKLIAGINRAIKMLK